VKVSTKGFVRDYFQGKVSLKHQHLMALVVMSEYQMKMAQVPGLGLISISGRRMARPFGLNSQIPNFGRAAEVEPLLREWNQGDHQLAKKRNGEFAISINLATG
jgi:hypothetical protein